MRDDLAPATETAVAQPGTSPTYLVAMGFVSPIYFSSRGDVEFEGNTYLEAGLEPPIGDNPTISVFNENLQFGQIVNTEKTAGRWVRVYQFYDPSDVIMMFSGVMGGSSVGRRVVIRTRRNSPDRTPRDVIAEPAFRYLMRPGTVIETPKQIITVE